MRERLVIIFLLFFQFSILNSRSSAPAKSSSKNKRRSGILGNHDESEGEAENLPSPGNDDDNAHVSKCTFPRPRARIPRRT